MQQENTSDALQHPPSFDEMVGLIKKLFIDYLEDVMKTPPSEIAKAWERYKTLNHLYQDAAQQPGNAIWVKATGRLPLHKAFWNMPGEHNNNECYFPVRIDGHRYRVGEIFDNRQEGAPDPIYYFVINGDDYYEKDFHRIEWLDEDEPPAEQPVAIWLEADTKPEHNVGVLVFIPGEDNHITSGMWDISNEWVLLDEYRTPEEEVTHWMPLPAFPEGYPHDMLSDEWVSTLKAIAKEELANRPSKEGNKEREALFLDWLTRESFMDLIAGAWCAKNDVAGEHPFTLEQIIEQYEAYNQQKEGKL